MRFLVKKKQKKTLNKFKINFVQILRMLLQHMQTFLVLSVFLG